jgi:hypothetical protein
MSCAVRFEPYLPPIVPLMPEIDFISAKVTEFWLLLKNDVNQLVFNELD